MSSTQRGLLPRPQRGAVRSDALDGLDLCARRWLPRPPSP